jgi:hypothetical protein
VPERGAPLNRSPDAAPDRLPMERRFPPEIDITNPD